ncbi:hypothetical protein [Nocardia brasiliensis]|uniref:hypothetical protein n=1 Tax=Nocardia brasiliensis TaxID=37326 RepID=UPI002456150B|nr:hypothetical protein [Nocardia brasiliensis]
MSAGVLEKCPRVVEPSSVSYNGDVRSVPSVIDVTAGWDIVRPVRMPILPDVDMAGFRISGEHQTELRAIPHPAVTVVIGFDGRAFDTDGVAGGLRATTLVAGLDFATFEVSTQGVECLQLRLSPLIAQQVLGVPLAELRGNVLALGDLWGRETSRVQEL